MNNMKDTVQKVLLLVPCIIFSSFTWSAFFPLPLIDLSVDAAANFSTLDTDVDIINPASGTNVIADEKVTWYKTGVTFTHSTPIIPNVALHTSSLSQDNVKWNNVTANTNSTANLKLTQSDLLIFYNVWDTLVTIDFGIKNRKLVLTLDADESDKTIPLAHTRFAYKIPFIGISAGVIVDASSISGTKINDEEVYISYNLPFGVVAQFGWTDNRLKIDKFVDTSVRTVNIDLTNKGYYLKAIWNIL